MTGMNPASRARANAANAAATATFVSSPASVIRRATSSTANCAICCRKFVKVSIAQRAVTTSTVEERNETICSVMLPGGSRWNRAITLPTRRSSRSPRRRAVVSLRKIAAKNPTMTITAARPPTAPRISDVSGVSTNSTASTPNTGSARVTIRLNTLVMPIAALDAAPLKPAWDNMPYCTPRPMAPPAGTALLMVNEA